MKLIDVLVIGCPQQGSLRPFSCFAALLMKVKQKKKKSFIFLTCVSFLFVEERKYLSLIAESIVPSAEIQGRKLHPQHLSRSLFCSWQENFIFPLHNLWWECYSLKSEENLKRFGDHPTAHAVKDKVSNPSQMTERICRECVSLRLFF